MAQCGRCRNTTHKGLTSSCTLHLFTCILKIAESNGPVDQDTVFCMKATEMSTMSEVKTEKSIHYNQFDLV